MNKKHLALAVVILLIAGAIYYLESQKARPGAASTVPDSIVEEEPVNEVDSSEETITTTTTKNDFLPDKVYVPDADVIKKGIYPEAPDIQGISGYINAEPFKLEELRGKVVLIDFWTYSCINCIRTQPYLNAWHEAYADDGLVIVGVHTPEFEFEKIYDNVEKAVRDAGLKYPVVQDNDYATWTVFRNRWWPRKFLIDIDGLIRYDHIGEGAYDQTEAVIQELLMERSDKLGMAFDTGQESKLSGVIDIDILSAIRARTPEIYFGYKFARGNLGSPESFTPEAVNTYAEPELASLIPNKAYLVGKWLNTADYSELVEGTGKIVINYTATKVNIVASSETSDNLTLLLDGLKIPPNYVGADGTLVDDEKLYNIVSTVFHETHMLEIQATQPGFRIYTFTFG